MQKSDKERVVAELTEKLRISQTLIVADYRGLSMTEIDRLRGELLQNGARFSVVKNTLTRRAAEAAGADALLELLEGPSAIAFLEPEGDPVTVAKVLNEAARSTRILVIRGGVLGGKVISEDDVKNLATLPPPDVLRAQAVGAISAPLTTVVGIFTAPLRDIVGILDARIRQLEELVDAPDSPAGGAASEPPSAAADEPGAEAPPAPVSEETESEDQEVTTEQEA